VREHTLLGERKAKPARHGNRAAVLGKDQAAHLWEVKLDGVTRLPAGMRSRKFRRGIVRVGEAFRTADASSLSFTLS
jgi:hypothetical protein